MEKVNVLKKNMVNIHKQSKSKNRKKSIRTKFVLLFTSIVFVPIVIVSIVLFYQVGRGCHAAGAQRTAGSYSRDRRDV
ncbi:MAG: hypothetical protein U5K84_10725 [Alkalibacterium sp.]|nr:hypothetical protein [Alkalibacterium sp.]